MKILLLTKSTPWCHLVQEVLRKSEHEVDIIEGERGHRGSVNGFSTKHENFDLIISYLCPWVLDKSVLDRAPRAINFHPGTPWQRGFAPYSWEIYEGMDEDMAITYGVTVHEMTASVDAGPILRSEYFSTSAVGLSVYRLQQKAMRELFRVFMLFFESDFNVPLQGSRPFEWFPGVKTKADFERLRLIPLDADTEEIERRIRACRYPGQPGAYFPGEE